MASGSAAEVLRFETAPDLVRLFAAAVLHGRHTGSELPDVVAERSGVVVEPAGVVDYAHVCGFTVGAHPPVTWPHMLAFPLQAAVMSRRDFPVPMVGLVHVENTMSWTRPVDYRESVDVRVQATDLRPHRRGRLVDLVAEIRPSRRSEVVWRGVSTYLARGPGDPSAPSRETPDLGPLRSGPSSAGGALVRFAEDDGRRYAAVSGDVNPIHLHALTARAFGFSHAIAHGMFAYARVLASLGARVPAAGTSTVWFRKPVPLPSTTRLAVSTDDGLAALLQPQGDGEHLVLTF